MTKKIAFVAQPEYFRVHYEDELKDTFETREFPFVYSMTDKNFDDLAAYDADYNFFFRGEFVPVETLKRLRGVKIALSSEPFPRKIEGKWDYTLDSLKRYLFFRRVRNMPFDYLYHYDIASAPLFSADGLQISGEFVFPVSLGTYKPEEREKKWDILFTGRSTKHRERFFGSLKHHYNFLHIAHGVWGKDLKEYIYKSKICLNIHAEKEVSWEPRMQVFMACGAFLISEKITPNEYLKPGREFIEASGPHDLEEKMKHYLAHPEEAERIARTANEKTLRSFDARKAYLDIISGIGDGSHKKFLASGSGSSFLNLLAKTVKL